MKQGLRQKGWIAGFLMISAAGVWADFPLKWKGSPGWEPESAYCRLYDAKRVVTLQGVVQRVEKVTPLKGMGEGIHLMLKTDSETIPVHLGPTWYVEKQPVQIFAEDPIEVTGSRVPCDGKPVILAALVRKGDETIKFREVKGTPLWSGVDRHQR